MLAHDCQAEPPDHAKAGLREGSLYPERRWTAWSLPALSPSPYGLRSDASPLARPKSTRGLPRSWRPPEMRQKPHEAAPRDHCGDPGEHSRRRAQTQRGDPAAAMMPWMNGPERALRNRLFQAQQFSARRARSSHSETARALFWLINTTAAAHATAPAAVEQLRGVADTLVRLALVANGFERIEARQ